MNLVKWSAVAFCTVALLTACQGQNPFKRESNPIRNYPKVQDSIHKHEAAHPYGYKQTPDNSQYCSGPFSITSNSPDGHTIFSFLEDSATTYEIIIMNRLGDAFEVEATGLPQGADFKLLRAASTNTSVYQLSWTPKNIIPAGEATFRPNVVLNLKSAALTAQCQGAMGSENLNLLVEKVKDRPTLTVTGLPQTQIKVSTSEVKFKVLVTDRLSTAQKVPILNGFGFDPAFKLNEDEIKVINGTAAADCNATPKYVNNKWEFSCKFLPSGLQANNEDGLRGSGKVGEAVFTVSAKSRVNDKSSNTFKASIKVLFEKVAPTAAAQGQRP